MLSANDINGIFLPVLGHWIIWLIFLIVVAVILFLYSYPYIRKPRKEFRSYHVGIPISNIISFYIFMKLLEGVIYHGPILKVDSWFNQTMVAVRSPWLTNIAFFITSFGTGILISILLIVTIGVLLLRKRWRYALLSLAAIAGATLLQLVIKNLVHRIRPSNSLEIISPGAFSASFPSGHTITAIVYVCLLVYSYHDDIKHIVAKYVLITAAVAFFITVGLTRIYLNAHWFSDVIAGISLGLFWFMTVVLVERSITGMIQAIRIETKTAEPIKAAEIIETAKQIIPKK